MIALNHRLQLPNLVPEIACAAEVVQDCAGRTDADPKHWCDTRRIALPAADGYPLTALRYSSSRRTRAHLIVAGATGVPQQFYRRFAQYAASEGYPTLTLDYRGVGLSAPPTLKGFRMDYFDWGRFDLAAAVDVMSHANVPLYLVGHSFGGQAIGMLPNHDKVAAVVLFGTGAGWHGWMPSIESVKVLAMWNVLGPLLTSWKGYLPLSLIGMGEDLPLDFYEKWKHWCRFPNYFFGDPSMRHQVARFGRVRVPILAATSIDDRWSPPRSRDAFMRGYTGAAVDTWDIDPEQLGLTKLGHMGYFRPDARQLWAATLQWLAARSATASTPNAAARAS